MIIWFIRFYYLLLALFFAANISTRLFEQSLFCISESFIIGNIFVMNVVSAVFTFWLCSKWQKNFSTGHHEFDSQKNHEVNEFRKKMRTFCEEQAQERQMLPWQHWMKFNFPCDLEPCSVVAKSGKSRTVRKILVNVKFEGSEVSEVQFYKSS